MRIIALIIVILLTSSASAQRISPKAAAAQALAMAAIQSPGVDFVVPVEPNAKPEERKPVAYKDAYALYKSERKPMVVMVTASWCPYCPATKNELQELQREGKLGEASLVIVDYDADKSTARDAMGLQRTLPAVAVYHYERGKAKATRSLKPSDVPAVLNGTYRPRLFSVVPEERTQAATFSYCRNCRG